MAEALPPTSDAPEQSPATIPANNLLSAGLILACSILASAGVIAGWEHATTAACVALGVFIAYEIVRVPAQQLMTGGVLAGFGLIAVFFAGGFLETLIRATEGTLIFVALFSAVAFLQYPALNSPSMRAAREVVVRQPPGRRYAMLMLAVHFFGALTNFAALSLLVTFLHGMKDVATRERLACGLIRGFALAASWSPFFVSIAVILYVLPELKWLDIAIPGVPLACIMLVHAWLFDRFFVRRFVPKTPGAQPARQEEAPVGKPPRTTLNISILALVLVTSILTVSEGLVVSTPIAIFLVVPPIALVWQWILSRGEGDGSLRGMTQSTIVRLASLRAEIVIFLSANFLGHSAGRAIDPQSIADLFLAAGVTGWMAIYVLLALMLSSTMAMIHPLVLIVLLGQIFPYEALGISEVSLALCMALVWGVGTTSSPGSGLTLFMMRVLDKSPWYVAWRLNAPYSISGLIVGGTVISILNRWLL